MEREMVSSCHFMPTDENEYRKYYTHLYGSSLNPYTANMRHPSQQFVYLPDFKAEGLTTKRNEHYSSTQFVMGPKEGQDLERSFSASSCESLESRLDTRSGGNPYAHHPNFTTPSQYFGFLMEEQLADGKKEEQDDVPPLTCADIANLADPFDKNWAGDRCAAVVNPPNDVTLNKHLFSTLSREDITRLDDQFPLKGAPFFMVDPTPKDVTLETMNKKLFSSDSLYELRNLNFQFEEKDDLEPTTNLVRMRDYSIESLDDLRQLRNFSAYSNFHEADTGAFPSAEEIAEFQYTENVQYGGI